MARSSASKAATPQPQSQRASPAPPQRAPTPPAAKAKNKGPKRKDDYTSEGVEDNDVFLLPVSDYQVMIGVTVLAAIVRLFRIYQPTSVVFDEVQYVSPWLRVRFTTNGS